MLLVTNENMGLCLYIFNKVSLFVWIQLTRISTAFNLFDVIQLALIEINSIATRLDRSHKIKTRLSLFCTTTPQHQNMTVLFEWTNHKYFKLNYVLEFLGAYKTMHMTIWAMYKTVTKIYVGYQHIHLNRGGFLRC